MWLDRDFVSWPYSLSRRKTTRSQRPEFPPFANYAKDGARTVVGRSETSEPGPPPRISQCLLKYEITSRAIPIPRPMMILLLVTDLLSFFRAWSGKNNPKTNCPGDFPSHQAACSSGPGLWKVRGICSKYASCVC